MKYSYKTKGTCSSQIDVNIENDIIKSVNFIGGCSGNTQGISSIVRGMNAEEVINKFKGIRCGIRSTSCPAQLSIALEEALNIYNKCK